MNIYILHDGHETAPGPPCATLVNCNNFTHVLAIVSMFIRNQGNKDKIQLGLNDTPRSQGALSVWFLYLVATMLLQLSWQGSLFKAELDSVRTQADLAETEGSQEDRSGCRERGAKTTPLSCTPRWVTPGHQGGQSWDTRGTPGGHRGGHQGHTWWGQKNRGQSWDGGSGTSLKYGSTTITPAWYFGQIQFLRIQYLIGGSE